MLYLRITIKTIIMEKQITYEQISQLLDSKLEPIKNDINAIKTDVGAIQTHVKSINERLYKLEERVAKMDSMVEKMIIVKLMRIFLQVFLYFIFMINLQMNIQKLTINIFPSFLLI